MTDHSSHGYAALQDFVEPARPRAEIWRILCGVCLVGVVWIVVGLGVFAGVGFLSSFSPAISLHFTVGPGGALSPPLLITALASFAGLLLGVWAALRLLHRRGLASVLGRAPGGFWRSWSKGALVLVYANAVLIPIALTVEPVTRGADLALWLVWLAPALLGIFLQTSAEEIAFRGYLLQQLGARFGSIWVWMLIPSVVFGLLHYNPGGYGANALLVVAITAILGAVAADITARTGSLAPAMGLHFANNVVAILVLSFPGPLTGLSLWTLAIDPGDVGRVSSVLLVDLLAVFLLYAGYRLWLRRRRASEPGC